MTEPDPPTYYPVSLDLTGRRCLVVGAGPVAARKARGLLEVGAVVTVVADHVSDDMAALSHRLQALERRIFTPGDVHGFRLVITATGVPAVDGAVALDAETAGIWVNSADDPAHCSFILPAVHRDGAVTVAVSTGGLSPVLASWLRSRLADHCQGMGQLASALGQARQALRRAGISTEDVDWAPLLDGPLLAALQSGDGDNVTAILAAALGN